MARPRRLAALAALAALAVVAACSARTRPSATADLEAIYRARADSARMRFTAAEARFMAAMIGHHAQALEMAALVDARDAGPAIRTLAGRITNAQRDEITMMQQWLRERGQAVPGGEPHSHGHMHAPGMLTPEQMRQLEGARGREFDRLFLTFMIQHHRGAVEMVHDLFATDGAAQEDVVFKLASDIQVDQITEIERMQLMLEEMNRS